MTNDSHDATEKNTNQSDADLKDAEGSGGETDYEETANEVPDVPSGAEVQDAKKDTQDE